jgi:flavodoxin
MQITSSMGAPKIKEELYHFIEVGDAKLIKMLYAVAKEYTQDDYTLSGKPMTANQLKTRVRDAKARIAKRQYTTHDDLEKEMHEW